QDHEDERREKTGQGATRPALRVQDRRGDRSAGEGETDDRRRAHELGIAVARQKRQPRGQQKRRPGPREQGSAQSVRRGGGAVRLPGARQEAGHQDRRRRVEWNDVYAALAREEQEKVKDAANQEQRKKREPRRPAPPPQ